MARTRDDIQRDYTSSIQQAEAIAEHDPERSREIRLEAAERRANAFDELHRDEQLGRAREAAVAKYPDADPQAVTGSTPEEIEAAAKRSHDHVQGKVTAAVEQTRAESRAEVARQWGPGGKPTVPRPEIVGQGVTTERTREVIQRELQEAVTAGDERRVLKLRRELGGLSGLDRWASSQVAAAREEARAEKE